MRKIKEVMSDFGIPRRIAILVCQLDMTFQPNFGSSLYRLPNKQKLIQSQRSWNCPLGTLRISDHWGYVNYKGDTVYKTNLTVPKNTWALAINYGPTYVKAWHIVQIFERLKPIDFNRIQKMVKEATKLTKK